MSEFKGLDDERMLFAVPKKGRLYEKVLKILQGAGLEYVRKPRLDIAQVKSLPLTLVFLPAHDIAEYVAKGKCDLGITGQDIIAEAEVEVKTLIEFGFGMCRLSVLGPVGKFKDASELSGGRVVTSFPNVTRKYFNSIDKPGKPTSIKYVSGSVEVACSLGIADGVVDLVETGTTMKAAGLEEVQTVIESQTVLITKKEEVSKASQDLIAKIYARIQGYMTSTRHVMMMYNCKKADLETCLKVTPGMQGPTISNVAPVGASSLAEWVSVQALVPQKKASAIMDELALIGGDSILLFSLANCRFPNGGDECCSC